MRVGIYTRVSTDEQDEGNQLIALRATAARAGYEVFKEYSDRAVSGRKARPALYRMLADARRHYIKGVLVWRFDRLGRSVSDLVQIANEMNELGVSLISDQEGLNTSVGTGKHLFYIAAMFAEMERDIISERTKLGLARARAGGKVLGAKKKFVDLGLARTLRAQGLSHQKIAGTLGLSRETVRKALAGATAERAAPT